MGPSSGIEGTGRGGCGDKNAHVLYLQYILILNEENTRERVTEERGDNGREEDGRDGEETHSDLLSSKSMSKL